MPCENTCRIDLGLDRVVSISIQDFTRIIQPDCFLNKLLLTDDAGLVTTDDPASGAYLTNDSRVRAIGTLSDALTHWDVTSETYRAIETMFLQNNRPAAIKVGWVDAANATTPETLVDGVEEIIKCDDCWYGLTHVHAYIDDTLVVDNLGLLQPLAQWADVNQKFLHTDSRDIAHQDPSNQNSITRRLKDLGVRRTAVYYHEGYCQEVYDENGLEIGTEIVYPYMSIASAAYIASKDLNTAGNAYTMKFKDFSGFPPSNLATDIVTSVTGFLPRVGLDPATGHFANMFVRHRGANKDILAEGTTVQGGFIDIVVALDFMATQLQQLVFRSLSNPNKVPYTERGMTVYVDDVVRAFALRMQASGVIADDEGTTTVGDLEFDGSFLYRREEVLGQPEQRRAQRLAPPISLCFRVAGAIHWVDITECAYA